MPPGSPINHLASAQCEGLNRRVLIFEATRTMKLTCGECGFKVCFRKGTKNAPHFAHYPSTTREKCAYYSSPSETQIHRDAKLYIQRLLQTNGVTINFVHKCCVCTETFTDISVKGSDKAVVECEISAKKLGILNESWTADVVRRDPLLILEVKHTHVTRTPRPEPWVEFEANELMSKMAEFHTTQCIDLMDISRGKICGSCKRSRNQELWRKLLLKKRKTWSKWVWILEKVLNKIHHQKKLQKENSARRLREQLQKEMNERRHKQNQLSREWERQQTEKQRQQEEEQWELRKKENQRKQDDSPFSCIGCKKVHVVNPDGPCDKCGSKCFSKAAAYGCNAQFHFV